MKIKSCIHDGWIAITNLCSEVDRDYIYYMIFSPASQAYFLKNAAGSGVLNLNAEIIRGLPVAFPSLQEQKAIAACLSCLDELIESQVEKIYAMKNILHGLQQRLFPMLDEIVA